MQTGKDIGFLGGGNMARSLIGGLVQRGQPSSSIHVHDIDAGKLQALAAEFGIQPQAAAAGLAHCDVIVLAIKPQQMASALRELAGVLGDAQPLLVSIAAGIRSETLARWIGGARPIVRCMPNTPALIGAGASVLYGNPQIDDAQRMLAESILATAGTTDWVADEDQLDAVTALSGSGPAYYFLLQELMVKAGRKLGLDDDLTAKLAAQTALGAARMVSESGTPAAELRRQVTSPGGTTERALAVFAERDLASTVEAALAAACERSRELAQQMDDDA